MNNRPIIGVMGGSKASDTVLAQAETLGRLIAQRGWILLNGGRNRGVMAATARGAKTAGGTVIGILPGRTRTDATPDLDVAIVTGLGDARNVINVLSSDLVIACPGGMGTQSEVALALKNDRPVILLGFELMDAPFATYRRRGQLVTVANPQEAIDRAAAMLP